MIDPAPPLAPGVPTYRLSGTVISGDIEALLATSDAPALALVIDPALDGYLAEVGHGVAGVGEGGGPSRVAVLAPDDMMAAALQPGLSTNGAAARIFPQSQRDAAIGWITG